MALTTTITAQDVAVALGRPAPAGDSPEENQWEMWIRDALMLINVRVDSLTSPPVVDQARVDYVVREAVVAHVRRPDDATQVTVAVDDGSTTRTYSSRRGRVEILAEWWTLLGLVQGQGKAFSIDTVSTRTAHMPWCSGLTYTDGAGNVVYGGAYCTCGADIAGAPIYETDGYY